MLARLSSASLRGLDAEAVDVEVDLSRGLPCWNMVGLPDASVREARDRVRSALLNSNFEFPLRHITVNLAPADKRKDGSHFDLPVAIGLLWASGQIPVLHKPPFILGELALDGRLNPISGVLPLVLFARKEGFETIIVPQGNAKEASVVEGIHILAATSLLQVAEHLSGQTKLPTYIADTVLSNAKTASLPDMADIRGQQQARRALEIAATGGHHLLMSGPPGVGKSMLAARLPSILPPLMMSERLQVARIYSVAGEAGRSPTSSSPPFRAPHHSASDVALIGGGSTPKPGEVSKSHCGILFLDELPEYKRQVLEVLRQPLENGEVCIARAADTLSFPAKFQLLAAMNPCPCGYLGHPSRPCRCSDAQVRRYKDRISGPLLDRFDLRIHVPPVEKDALMGMQTGESSSLVAQRVQEARKIQYERQGEGVVNARLQPTALERFAKPDAEGAKLLGTAMTRFSLSARSYHRILKVARSIADLAQEKAISSLHIAEALQYRGDEV
ncbi:YifB family Mg chelatase-like AAA ATPase [Mariprofundus ferrooxydans]|nr:YifB family Mg chelatase-like AAA ATPase [Mariprofundus ferrooxydans]